MQRAVHLVQQVVVGAAQQQRRRARGLAAADEDHVVITHALLHHLLRMPQERGVKGLVALHVRERGNHCGAAALGNAAQVFLGDAPARNHAPLHKVLQAHVVNALGSQHHVGARCQHLLDALLGDVALTVADALQLCGICHQHLHAKHHPGLLQVHVQASDLGALDMRWHALRSAAHVERVPLEKLALRGALTMRFENVD
mmetsp:Transcript_38496/g.98440  ORF Transcript_38496/g.98440 Transcript_38496/m.98440 type:complete len:200 (-) Transcript_38496:773-1372(-)